MNFFGIGLPDMAVIATLGLLVFGPKRLPELGKTLGRTLRGFQSASQEFEKEFRSAIQPEAASVDQGSLLAATSTPDPLGASGMVTSPLATSPAVEAHEVASGPDGAGPPQADPGPVA
jgi:sec-independent protein translocase protein TatA